MRSIIGQCAECCECPQPVLRTAVRSKSKEKCGFSEFEGFVSTPPKKYRRKEYSGTWSYAYQINGLCGPCYYLDDPEQLPCVGSETRQIIESGYYLYNTETCAITGSNDITGVADRTGGTCELHTSNTDTYYDPSYLLGGSSAVNATKLVGNQTSPHAGESWDLGYSDLRETNLSDEYTTDLLITYLLAGLASGTYGAWFGSSVVAGALLTYFVISEDELTASAYQSKYRFRHKFSRMGSGCYRVLWDQVYIPKCGRGIASVESVEQLGGYTPGEEIAVVVPDPSAVCVTNSPTTITATANAEGILEFAVTVAGMGYLADVTATVDGHDLLVHLDGAAAEEYQFSGDVPEGYDPLDPETWPESPVVEPALPEGLTAETVGAIYLMNIRSICRGCV